MRVRVREVVSTCKLGTDKLRGKWKNKEEERKKGVLHPMETSMRCQPGNECGDRRNTNYAEK